jgi:hypothetical protein
MIIPYARVSSGRQLEGLSMTIQGDSRVLDELSRKYNTTVSPDVYVDQGVSSYKGKNVSHGELGRLLKDIKSGKIKSGDIIVMRALDRLSRQALTDSEILYNSIVGAGVNIHTTIDGYLYEKNGVMASVMKTLALNTANEESQKKGHLTNQHAQYRIDQFQRGEIPENGTSFDIGIGRHPFWIQLKDKVVQPHDHYFKAIKIIVKMFLEGHGNVSVLNTIQELYPEDNFTIAMIVRTYKRDTLIGRLNVTLEDKEYQLENYYPKVCTEAELFQIREFKKSRTFANSKNFSALAGMEMFYCSCGWSVSGITSDKGYRSYRCIRPKPCFHYVNQRTLNHVVLDAVQTHIFKAEEVDISVLNTLIAEHALLQDKTRKQQNILMEDPDLFDHEAKTLLKQNKDKLNQVSLSIDKERQNHFQVDLDLDSYQQWQDSVVELSLETKKEPLQDLRRKLKKIVKRIEVNNRLVSITMMDNQVIYRHMVKNKQHDIVYCKIKVVDQKLFDEIALLSPELTEVFCIESDLHKFTKERNFHPDRLTTISTRIPTDHGQIVNKAVTDYLKDNNVLLWKRAAVIDLGITTSQWAEFKDGSSLLGINLATVNYKNKTYNKKTCKIAFVDKLDIGKLTNILKAQSIENID